MNPNSNKPSTSSDYTNQTIEERKKSDHTIIEMEEEDNNSNSSSNYTIWNTISKLCKRGSVLLSIGVLTAAAEGYIENSLVSDKENENINSKIFRYISWGLAAQILNFAADKISFHLMDNIILNIKELITGKQEFADEKIMKKEINEVIKRVAVLEKEIIRLNSSLIAKETEINLSKEQAKLDSNSSESENDDFQNSRF